MSVVAVAGLSMALAGAAAAAPTIVLPRPGQVGFSVGGGYGTLLKGGEFGDEFSSGGSLAIRAKYRMRYERAIGVSFERQGFSPRDPQPPDSLFAPVSLTLQTASFEIYQMFGTRTRTVRMLSAGLGLVMASQKLRDGEEKLGGSATGDGLALSLGAGVERFLWQSWALDLSTRYYAIFHQSAINSDFQVSAGLCFYAGY
jgi:opacity protein-like surface antigen